jgi:Asp-tRNA(Asn)/Glu-tRNA(Gln) amidotransferase A subunit family amidase
VVTATEIAQQVRRGRLSAVDVVSEAVDRAEHATHNAYTLIDRAGAVRHAAHIDALVAEGNDPGPLAGVPIALKDLIDQSGLPTTCGSSFYREVPARSAAVVDRLEAAGAVIIGRTGLHEFAYGFSSENEWFGPVRNPWDPETSPGGSSGGSAVAVAEGSVPVAIGTDTGGSVRVPAGMCAVVGLKVTHGRVPLTGVFPLAPSLDTVGPFARTVPDVELVYSSIAGFDESDPWSSPRDPGLPAEMPLSGLRVGVPHPWIDEAPIASAATTAFEDAVGALSDAGAYVADIDAPWLLPSKHGADIVGAEAAHIHRSWFGTMPYGSQVHPRLAAAMEVTLDDYLDARRWMSGLRSHAMALFADVDVLVTPTVPATRKRIGEPFIDGVPYIVVLSWFSSLVNQLGVPALSVPLDTEGSPPPSLQIIGPWWSERSLLAIGRSLESADICRPKEPPVT